MRRNKSKLVTIIICCFCVAVLILVGIYSRNSIKDVMLVQLVQKTKWRVFAVTTLGPPRSEEAIVSLVEEMRKEIRDWAADVVKHGPLDEEFVGNCVASLVKVGRRAVPHMLRSVADSKCGELRRRAVELFERLGGEADVAIPYLEDLARETGYKEIANRAIVRIKIDLDQKTGGGSVEYRKQWSRKQ